MLAVGRDAPGPRLRPGPRAWPAVDSMYDAARVVGDQVRRVSELDRQALEQDDYKFNVHIILAGQIRGQPHDLYLIYPQGNPLRATEDSPFLQIGECKYGRPILDRGIRYDRTTLEDAAQYALISIDSTMRSNVTVGPPIDLLVYARDELQDHPLPPLPRARTPTSSPSTPSGSRPCARPSRNCPRSRSNPPGEACRGVRGGGAERGLAGAGTAEGPGPSPGARRRSARPSYLSPAPARRAASHDASLRAGPPFIAIRLGPARVQPTPPADRFVSSVTREAP